MSTAKPKRRPAIGPTVNCQLLFCTHHDVRVLACGHIRPHGHAPPRTKKEPPHTSFSPAPTKAPPTILIRSKGISRLQFLFGALAIVVIIAVIVVVVVVVP